MAENLSGLGEVDESHFGVLPLHTCHSRPSCGNRSPELLIGLQAGGVKRNNIEPALDARTGDAVA